LFIDENFLSDRSTDHRTASMMRVWTAFVATLVAATIPPEQPRQVLLEARSQLSHIDDKTEHWGRTREIAQWLAWARLYDDAIATARMDTTFLAFTIEELGRIRAANGDVEGATSMVDSATPGPGAVRARSAIAADLADQGNLDKASRVAQSLTGRAQDDVRLAAAARQISDGKLAQAESTIVVAAAAGAFVDDIRVDLAEAYVRHGNDAAAQRIARDAKNPNNPPDFAQARIERAVERRAWGFAKTLITTGDSNEIASAFVTLARSMVRAQDTLSAAQTLEAAVPFAVRINDAPRRLDVLSDIAVAQFDLGLPPTAPAHMDVPDLSKSPEALGGMGCQVTWAFAKARRFSDANVLARATHCGVASVAGFQFRAGDVDGALETMREVTNRSVFVSTMSEFASFAAQKGNLSMAERVFGVLQVKERRDDGYMTPAVGSIAHLMARASSEERALMWSRARPTPDQRAAALTGVARAMIEKTNPNARDLMVR
jgi:hypothetical protein